MSTAVDISALRVNTPYLPDCLGGCPSLHLGYPAAISPVRGNPLRGFPRRHRESPSSLGSRLGVPSSRICPLFPTSGRPDNPVWIITSPRHQPEGIPISIYLSSLFSATLFDRNLCSDRKSIRKLKKKEKVRDIITALMNTHTTKVI